MCCVFLLICLTLREIDAFVRNVITSGFSSMKCCTSASGSFPLRCYLPDSDLDAVVFFPGDEEPTQRRSAEVVLSVFNSLCKNIMETSVASSIGRDPAFVIRNVEFRNARTKLAHCVVNNQEVDVTLNQVNALASNLLLEEADRIIGMNHVFKKSVLLMKV
jgi:hypothetical protein